MKRSRGFKSRSRNKLTKTQRPGRSNPITKKIQTFDDILQVISKVLSLFTGKACEDNIENKYPYL